MGGKKSIALKKLWGRGGFYLNWRAVLTGMGSSRAREFLGGGGALLCSGRRLPTMGKKKKVGCSNRGTGRKALSTFLSKTGKKEGVLHSSRRLKISPFRQGSEDFEGGNS